MRFMTWWAMSDKSCPKLSIPHTSHQRLTLVHFSAEPESFLVTEAQQAPTSQLNLTRFCR